MHLTGYFEADEFDDEAPIAVGVHTSNFLPRGLQDELPPAATPAVARLLCCRKQSNATGYGELIEILSMCPCPGLTKGKSRAQVLS